MIVHLPGDICSEVGAIKPLGSSGRGWTNIMEQFLYNFTVKPALVTTCIKRPGPLGRVPIVALQCSQRPLFFGPSVVA